MRYAGLIGVCLLVICSPCFAAEFYVATDGVDMNPGTKAKPFASLEGARDAIRDLKSKGQLSEAVTVNVLAGEYVLEETLAFGPEDGGTEKAPITYLGMAGEKVMISGGRRVGGWKQCKGEILQADLKGQGLGELRFRELYYKGKAQHAARVPNFDAKYPRTGGYTYTMGVVGKSNTIIKYDPNAIDPAGWTRTEKAYMDIFPGPNYGNGIFDIKGVNIEDKTITKDKGGYKIYVGDRFYVMNIFEELDAPGEWYFDDDSGVLYFWPPDGSIKDGDVVIPAIGILIEIKGDAEKKQYIEWLEIKGFHLGYCKGTIIAAEAAKHCTIAKCTISNNGGRGKAGKRSRAVGLGLDCHYNRIVGNDIMHIGSVGVHILGDPHDHSRNSHNIVSNNHIYYYGDIISGAAIYIEAAGNNLVSHNLVHDGPYAGFLMNCGNDTVIEYNHFHHTSLETQDTGAVYTVTNSRGWKGEMSVENNKQSRNNAIRYNLIHDTGGYGRRNKWKEPWRWQSPFFSWGIYMDFASSGQHIHGNVIYNTYSGAYMIGGGQDNVCENNIFIEGKEYQVFFHIYNNPKGKLYFPMERNRFERNIIVYCDPNSHLYRLAVCQPNNITTDRNIVYNFGQSMTVEYEDESGKQGQEPWQWWKDKGMDSNTIVADPLFVDAKNHDYRLKADSPALDMGFKPIDLSSVGLYASPERASWPIVEETIYRETPLEYPGRKPEN